MSIFIPYTFNSTAINDGTNYRAKILNNVLLPSSDPRWIPNTTGHYPSLSGAESGKPEMYLMVTCLGTVHSQFDTLKALFDTNKGPYILVCKDSADSDRQWYCYAKCTGIDPPNARNVRVTLSIDFSRTADAWLTVATETEADWDITTSPKTQAFTIDIGNLSAYPVYTFTPLSTRGAGWKYRRFIEVINTTTISIANYPITITLDGSALYGAGKILSNGDDIRIFTADSGGDLVEVPRWFSATPSSTSTLKVWFNVNITVPPSIALNSSMTSGDTLLYVPTTGPALGTFPSENGLMLIDNERIIYDSLIFMASEGHTGYYFTGLHRGQCDTSAASHSAGASIIIIPEIWCFYGNSAATTPSYSTTYKPLFSLADSTNSSRVFESYRNTKWSSVEQWSPSGSYYSTDKEPVGSNQPNPTTLIGASAQVSGENGLWTIHEPFGVTAATFTDIDAKNVFSLTNPRSDTVTNALVLGSQTGIWGYYSDVEYIPYQVDRSGYTGGTWENTASVTMTCSSYNYYIAMMVRNTSSVALSGRTAVQAESVTLTLSTSTTSPTDGVPTVSLDAESETAYPLEATFENTTTGYEMTVNEKIPTGGYLVVDTLQRIVYNASGKKRLSAITWDTIRDEWLAMTLGSNTLKYTESSPNIRVVVQWQGRHN